MDKRIFVFLVLGLMFVSLTSALDNQGSGVVGQDFTFIQTCEDATYITISTIQYPNRTVAVINTNMTSTGGGSFQYNITNLEAGRYDLCGISDGCTKTFCVTIEPRPNNIGVTLLFGLFIFFILALIGLIKLEDYRGKFALYWVCHVLMVAITFTAWDISRDSLITGSAVTGIFKVFFYFCTIAVFPMVILSIAWIIYIHAFNEHFQKLVDKGETPESAFKMASKKKGGWFNGK